MSTAVTQSRSICKSFTSGFYTCCAIITIIITAANVLKFMAGCVLAPSTDYSIDIKTIHNVYNIKRDRDE